MSEKRRGVEREIAPYPDHMPEAMARLEKVLRDGDYVDFNSLERGAKQAAYALAQQHIASFKNIDGRTKVAPALKLRRPILEKILNLPFLDLVHYP